MKKPPIIALVGRTNVGKSTLFNRLSEKGKVLVSDEPGTTRDRSEADCFWRGKYIRVIDTGGLTKDADPFKDQIDAQVRKAMDEADLALFLVDTQAGLLPEDRFVADELRKKSTPTILVANKADKAELRKKAGSDEWKALGFGEAIPVSSTQGVGTGDLLDLIWDKLKELNLEPVEITDIRPTRITMIGTPNVGKSSFLNKLIKEERFIASPVAHTTREPNDVLVEHEGEQFLFIDTAGIRRISKVKKEGGLEMSGVRKSLGAIKRADIALFVIDVTQNINKQEKYLAGILEEAEVGVIVIANKWDLVKNKEPHTKDQYVGYFANQVPHLTWAPMLFTSALSGQRVDKVFPLISHVQQERHKHIHEQELWDFLKKIMKQHKPSRGKGLRHPTLIRFRQIGVAPPTFELIVRGARVDTLHPSYLRYIKNRMRETYGFDGTPIVIRRKAQKKRAK